MKKSRLYNTGASAPLLLGFQQGRNLGKSPHRVQRWTEGGGGDPKAVSVVQVRMMRSRGREDLAAVGHGEQEWEEVRMMLGLGE